MFHSYVIKLGPYPVHLSFKEVTVCAGHEVLVEVVYNSAMIVGKPQVILGQQLRPHSMYSFMNSIFCFNEMLKYLLWNYIIKLRTTQSKGGNKSPLLGLLIVVGSAL